MTYEQLIKFYGSQTKAARALGIRNQTISAWKTRGRGIPFDQQFRIQLKTRGKLKADVTSLLKAA